MIEEPPLIRLLTKQNRKRPTPEQVAAFQAVQTGMICDAMNGSGALDMAIKPLPGVPQTFAGPALTADCGPADILALICALSEVQPGDVVVTGVSGFQGCAALGDMVAGQAKNAGAAAIVTDGPARDIAGIRAVGLPIFATGLTPNSPQKKGPGTVGHPVQIGGCQVESGDMIIGDEDGVVVVPFAQIDRVLDGLTAVRAAEAKREAEVQAGLVCPNAILDLMNSDQVERS